MANPRPGAPYDPRGRPLQPSARDPITTADTSGVWQYRGRPLGVVLLVLIQVAHALAVAFSLTIPGWSPFQPLQPTDALAPIDPAAPVVVLVGLTIALGLWFLRYWAWLLTMCWTGISMAGALIAYFDGDPAYLVMLISVIAVLYLNQRDVRRAFAGGVAPRWGMMHEDGDA